MTGERKMLGLAVVFTLLLALTILSQSVIASPAELGLEPYWTYYSLDLGAAGQLKVNLFNGNLVYTANDLTFKEAGFSRVYNSLPEEMGLVGYNWTLTYDRKITENYDGSVNVIDPDGTVFNYAKIGSGVYQKPAGATWELTQVSEEDNYFLLSDKEGKFGEYYFLSGQLAKITSPEKVIRFNYDYGVLKEVVIEPENEVIYVDGSLKYGIQNIITPDNRCITYNRDGAWDLVYADAPSYGRINYAYSNHHLKAIYLDGTNGTYIEYDTDGRVTAVVNADGQYVKFNYKYPTTEVYTATQQVYTFTFNEKGNLVSVVEPGGVVTDALWNDNFKITSITDANGGTRMYDYDQDGYLRRTISAVNGETTYEYDANGNNTRIVDPEQVSSIFDYDAENRLIAISDDLGNTANLSYDTEQNKVTYTDPNGAQTISLNPNENEIQVIDPAGTVSANVFDQSGKLISGIVRDQEGKVWQDMNIHYDLENNWVAIKDGEYTTGVQFDPNGNITNVQRPNGSAMQFAYTQGNKLSAIYYDGQLQYSYEYDTNGNVSVVTQPNMDRPFQYYYNEQNRLSLRVDPTGDTINYAYDKVGNVETIKMDTNGGSFQLVHTYDANNRLITTSDFKGGTTEFVYALNGRTKEVHYPNGVQKLLAYDPANRIAGYAEWSNYSLFSGENYTYDNAGNVLTVTDRTNKLVTAYSYNDLGLLVSETDPWTGELTVYSYDAFGNRTNKTIYNADGTIKISLNYYYNQSGNGISLFYDVNGNLTTDGYKWYYWDANNRLVEVRDRENKVVATYTYDSDNRRLSKTFGGKTIYYHYIGNRVAYETDQYGQIINLYTYTGTGEPLSITTPNGTYYYHTNPEGNVLAITDDYGNPVTTYSYDAFGMLIDTNGQQINNPYRYGGNLFDSETGLYYVKGRYYDPQTGRYLNKLTDSQATSAQANGFILTPGKVAKGPYISSLEYWREYIKTHGLYYHCGRCGKTVKLGVNHICIGPVGPVDSWGWGAYLDPDICPCPCPWPWPWPWPGPWPWPPGPWPPDPGPWYNPDELVSRPDFEREYSNLADLIRIPELVTAGGTITGWDGGAFYGSMSGEGDGHITDYKTWLAIYMRGPGPRINLALSVDQLTEIAQVMRR